MFSLLCAREQLPPVSMALYEPASYAADQGVRLLLLVSASICLRGG